MAAQTINDVFAQKKLWAWFNSPVTNAFDGVSEKGEDYSTAFGTIVAVPVGGVVKRIVHNNNAINDVIELMASDGSVWLYQHINSLTSVGQTLQCGSAIGTENGLPIDQYSTGPHIEVRYCAPGTWKANIDSWVEPWINPRSIFSNIGNQQAGTVANNGVIDWLNNLVNPSTGKAPITIAPTADVTLLLWVLDQVLALTNPFTVQNVQVDTLSGGPVNISFSDPIAWAEQVGGNIVDDLSAAITRAVFLAIGVFLILKVLFSFIDGGAIIKSLKFAGEAAGAAGV